VSEPSAAPLIPDYDGPCVAGIVPALLGRAPAPWVPEVATSARTVVLLVLDGLGWNVIDERPELVPNLAAMTGRAISTVSPATTAAALTSITTGLPPAQHGITGFRMRVDDAVINALRWSREPRGAAPEPHAVQRHPPFLGSAVDVITKSDFRATGFTDAHLRGVPFHGWKTVSSLVEQVRRRARAGGRLVYAYYPGIDEVAHEHGLRDGFYEAELRFADELVGRVLAELPSEAALIVTADHGQVHVEPDDWVSIADLEPLLVAQAGDARFRHLHAAPGAAKELAAECERRWSDIAWVRTRRQVLDEAWLGTDAARVVPGRIGDVVLAPFAPVGFIDPALPRERELRSAHGAPTPAEMLVPLLAAAGRA
jgi:hypothetical protein